MADRIGQQLGNYRLVRLLGQGGFAEVYLGEHIYLDTQAAIKVLHARLSRDDSEQFRLEAKRVAHLEHPHIVRVLDFGLEGTTPFLVMSYAPNGTLRQRHAKGVPLPLTTVVHYVKQIADALQYAHEEKFIHRDVKPENMLLGRRNEVLLSDFGIATIVHSTTSLSVQGAVGTIPYMAPEQLQEHPRPASDQYSLAVVVYEWLSGSRPFDGSFTELVVKHLTMPPPSLRARIPTISPAVEQVVLTALAKDYRQRFASVQAFAGALEQASQSWVVSPSFPPTLVTPPNSFATLTDPATLPGPSAAPPNVLIPSIQSPQPTNVVTPPNEGLPPNVAGRLPRTPPASLPPIRDPMPFIQTQPARHRFSRRAVILGLVGLTVAGAGGALTWLTLSQGSQNAPGSAQNTPGASSSQTASNSSSVLKAGPGVDVTNKTITLGILSAYTGPVAASIGIPLANGVKAYFDHVNDNGGIDGFTVKFLEEDTQYDPQIEVQKYNQIHNQIAMIADSLGTPTTFAIKDLAAADHMLVSVGALSSSVAREKYLILTGTPYRLQVENAFDYVVNKLGVPNPATGIIYQNDEYGQDGLTGYKEAITAYHLHDVGQASYAVTDTNFTAQVSQMKAAGAKYVFLTTIPSATAGIIDTAYQLGYNPQWILQSPAFFLELLAVPALKPLLSRAWVVTQGAAWGDTSVPGIAQMLQDVQKYFPNQKPDAYFEFGYTESWITYAILKKALDNNDITRDGLFNAFESLHSVDLGGLYPPVTYGSSPDQRVPTRDSVIYQIDPTQPTGIKPLTQDFTGTAAMQSQF